MDGSESLSGVEVALVGFADRQAVTAWLRDVVRRLLGLELAEVDFTAGRIDAVYGVSTADGQRLLIKVHRPPVDLANRRLVGEAQRALAGHGFPCADPLTGPVDVEGRWVSIETLLTEGDRADAHDPAIRASIAAGLAEHIRILSAIPGFAERVGEPPAWCIYQRGAWAVTHDPYFDFSNTPDEYAWLQRFAQHSADLTVALRTPARAVAAHADWYAGNLRFTGPRLSAAFDWDLVADTEPIVAGITAGTFSSGTSPAATPPSPEEASAFLADYEAATGRRFSAHDRRLATAAACWSVAYIARCDLTQLGAAGPRPGSALELLGSRRPEYLHLEW